MDMNTMRGIGTLLAFAAFLGVCWWAYGSRRKQGFDEAANLPFADEPQNNVPRKEHAPTQQSGFGEKSK
jgi:cytochrome c oxidase cbb3-type subunit 4